MEAVLRILPEKVIQAMQEKKILLIELEEIRIRSEQPVELCVKGISFLLNVCCTHEDVASILGRISHHSVYMLEEELKKGFITIEGGHRVGIAGKVITEAGLVKRIRDVSSLNIRVAKEIKQCSETIIPFLYEGDWKNTVFIGPPQSGKTTLLRDLTRVMSSGHPLRNIKGRKVGVVDERSEITGSIRGVPQFELGPRVDVLDGCPKAEGIMMMIRSMSPDVVVVDEIGGERDGLAILEAVHAGVRLILSAHGYTYDDFIERPYFRSLLSHKIIERYVILSGRRGPGTIESVIDERGRNLYIQGCGVRG